MVALLILASQRTAALYLYGVFARRTHTHDDIDRFCSRLRVAIAGRDYYTVGGLMKMIVDGLPGFNIRRSHLHTVWGWKNMEVDLDLPALKRLRRVHVVNFSLIAVPFLSNGNII